MKLTLNIKNIFLFLFLFTMILPVISIGGFDLPISYLFAPLGIALLFFVLLGKVTIPKILKRILIIATIILLEILVFSIYSSMKYTGNIKFPSDILQYFIKFTYLISFIIFAYKGYINKDKFIKYMLIILTLGMIVGILEWINWPGRLFFTELYPFGDGEAQLAQLNREMHLIRIHGFAQHATANGGISSFAFLLGISIFKYYDKYKLICSILMGTALINLFISQARAGVLALICSVIFLYFVDIKYTKRSLKPTLYFLISTFLIVCIFTYLYKINNPYIVQFYDRWIVLLDTNGGTRANEQPTYFFNLMSGSDYFFGLSKNVINNSAISYGVEIEYINIFITYGLFGFILQYSLVIYLLVYFFSKINKKITDKAIIALMIASICGLFSYQIFSVAFFFYKEIRIGLFPWVLMGAAIGFYEKYNNQKYKRENI